MACSNRLLLSLSLLLPACVDGSLGEYGMNEGDDGSGSASASSTADGSGPASASASGTSGDTTDGGTSGTTDGNTESTAGSESTGGATSTTAGSEGSSESGTVGICDNPDFLCAEPLACDATCGTLDSLFDEQGCLRRACFGLTSECDGGEVCYRSMDFGGCAPSGAACNEIDGKCQCGSLPDCGGAYCVPEELYPVGIEPIPAGDAVGVPFCGPANGQWIDLFFASSGTACVNTHDADLHVVLPGVEKGDYLVASTGTTATHLGETVVDGRIRITSVDDGTISGEVTLVFSDHAIIDTFTDVPRCEFQPCA